MFEISGMTGTRSGIPLRIAVRILSRGVHILFSLIIVPMV
jgi:hypothetical protein